MGLFTSSSYLPPAWSLLLPTTPGQPGGTHSGFLAASQARGSPAGLQRLVPICEEGANLETLFTGE